jgi:hypothetical protein
MGSFVSAILLVLLLSLSCSTECLRSHVHSDGDLRGPVGETVGGDISVRARIRTRDPTRSPTPTPTVRRASNSPSGPLPTVYIVLYLFVALFALAALYGTYIRYSQDGGECSCRLPWGSGNTRDYRECVRGCCRRGSSIDRMVAPAQILDFTGGYAALSGEANDLL